MQSVELNIADLANGWMKSYELEYKLEQESLNAEIDKARNDYFSKNGGNGGNRPDAKLLLEDEHSNYYPDYEQMSMIISTIQKLVIKDVVLYTDKKLRQVKPL